MSNEPEHSTPQTRSRGNDGLLPHEIITTSNRTSDLQSLKDVFTKGKVEEQVKLNQIQDIDEENLAGLAEKFASARSSFDENTGSESSTTDTIVENPKEQENSSVKDRADSRFFVMDSRKESKVFTFNGENFPEWATCNNTNSDSDILQSNTPNTSDEGTKTDWRDGRSSQLNGSSASQKSSSHPTFFQTMRMDPRRGIIDNVSAPATIYTCRDGSL